MHRWQGVLPSFTAASRVGQETRLAVLISATGEQVDEWKTLLDRHPLRGAAGAERSRRCHTLDNLNLPFTGHNYLRRVFIKNNFTEPLHDLSSQTRPQLRSSG